MKENPWLKWSPAILVGAAIVIYLLFNFIFVQCWFGGCRKIDGNVVTALDETKTLPLSNIPNLFVNKNTVIDAEKKILDVKIQEKTNKTREIAKNEEALALKKREIADLLINDPNANITVQNTNANAITTNLNAQKLELTALSEKATRSAANINAVGQEITVVRNDVSSRYGYSLLWLFLTGIFLALVIAACCFSYYVMKKTLEEWKTPLVTTAALAIGLIIGFFIFDGYSISRQIFERSISANGDLSLKTIDVFNAIIFAAIAFLTAAACAILYRAGNPTTPVDDQRTELRNYSRVILYIGSVMLFAGVLRFNLLTDWHILFVDGGIKQTLKEFFKNALSVQAAFYTILLALIYLPMSYLIPGTQKEKSVMAFYADTSLLETIMKFAPRLLALILPFLATPIKDLLGYIFGGQTD